MRKKHIFPAVILRGFDLLNALFLACYAFLILGPLGFLRGPLLLEKFFAYLRVLLSAGLLSRSIRVAIEWRLGHFDVAISQAEELIVQIEAYCRMESESVVRRRVLADLYTILTRAYLHAGHIDEAMQVVLRARKFLGIERLTGLVDLDAKTAHLVRAGLAAGRLLDGSGMATMFVKTHETDKPVSSVPPHRGASSHHGSEGSHESAPGEEKDISGARVIPFPNCPQWPQA